MNLPFKNTFHLIWLMLLLSGCAKTLLTINSQPEGAYITQPSSRKNLGIAPITVSYEMKELKKFTDANGCFLVKGFEATWSSGASKSTGTIKLCVVSGLKFEYTIERGTEYPGLDKDLQFALQVQAARQQQNQPTTSGAESMLYLLRGAAEGYNQNQEQLNQRILNLDTLDTTECSSKINSLSNTLDTTCIKY